MKKTLFILSLLAVIIIFSCQSSKRVTDKSSIKGQSNDTIRIANDSLEYEVIIFEPGFNAWLATQQPRGFYTQSMMEINNHFDVVEYNLRVRQPERFDPDLYPLLIDYRRGIDYGYEVNYLLFHYFMYFEMKYNQQLR
jgi:hypothetical protein